MGGSIAPAVRAALILFIEIAKLSPPVHRTQLLLALAVLEAHRAIAEMPETLLGLLTPRRFCNLPVVWEQVATMGLLSALRTMRLVLAEDLTDIMAAVAAELVATQGRAVLVAVPRQMDRRRQAAAVAAAVVETATLTVIMLDLVEGGTAAA